MTMTENKWKAALKKAFVEAGADALSLHGHGMQAPGWPDLWIGHWRWSGWLELKAHKGELSTAQRIIGRKLERRQQFYCVRATAKWDGFTVEDSNGNAKFEALSLLDAQWLLLGAQARKSPTISNGEGNAR